VDVGPRVLSDGQHPVNELGSCFPSGVTSTHGVALWTSSETELATTTLSGDGGAAGFQFTAITPVDLTAGQDYFVGGTTTGDSYIAPLSVPTVASQIDYIIHAEIGTSGVTPIFSTSQFSSFSDFGGNFAFSTMPEPSTWAMLIVGFTGLGFVGYRSRKAASFAA
jgi:hypothetical protein